MSELTREQIRRKAAIKKRVQQKAQAFQSRNENEQGYLGDSVDAFQHGLISGGADLADGVRYITGSETAGNIADSWRGSAEEQINQMSPAGREAMQSFGINTDDGIGFNEGSSVGGFGLNVISGLGSFAPTMIPGGLAARGLSTVGKVAGATGKAGKIVDKAADVAGFGGVGALAIGGGTANQAYETVAKADLNTLAESEVFKQRYWEMRDYQEMGHEQALTEARESIAKEIAEEAAKDGAALGAISQGALGPVFGRLFRGEVGGYAKSIAAGAATEGAQELVESGGQSAIANKNVNPAIPTDTMDGVVGDALTGAMTGAAVGGGFGLSGKATRDVLNRNKPEPEDTLPGEQDETTARADELQSEIDQLDDQIQNNSDELSDAEYSALLQRREALLREQLGESIEFAQNAELEPLPDLAGPQQQQPLGLLPPENGPQPPRFDTIYGEYQPSEQQQAARETTRRSFEEPVTEARQSRKARDEAYQLQKQQQEQIEQTRRERQQQEAQKRQREDQVALGQLEVGSEVKAAKGNQAKAYTPSNKSLDVEYQIVEASDLTTSHDDNFQARADYPQALQNRDRSSPALRKQVEDNAKNLIPEKLGEDSGVVSGAPIIRNGVVESGNGRTMSIRRAYNDSGAANYRQYLENNAERLGISKEELSQFNQPVLVRQRLNDMTPDELTSYTKDANTTDAFALNPVEQAKSDSNRVTDDDMSLIDIPESGDFAAASNRSFVRKFLGRFPKAEQNAMLNGDGTISDGGISRVQNAIFAKAYGSDQLIEDITSTSADDMKTVAKALINAAPEVAKLNAQGGVEGFTDIIVDAVNIVKRSRRDDVPVKELTDQFDLMSESTVDPTTASLANYLDQNVRSIKRMTDAIKGAAQRGQDGLRNSETDGLFGRAPAPTVANILNFGGESSTPSGKQINESGKQPPAISEKSTESGKENDDIGTSGNTDLTETNQSLPQSPSEPEVKVQRSGRPYSTKKSAQLSRTFSSTPNAQVVEHKGGYGIIEGEAKAKDNSPEQVTDNPEDGSVNVPDEVKPPKEALMSLNKGEAGGMNADDVRAAVEPLINDLHERGTFEVVQSINDLPFGIRLQAKAKLKKSKGENPVLRGINAGDKNYLIADGLRNEKEAVEIFLHEVVGHKAVLDMLGKEGDNIMEQIAVSYGRKGLADLIKTYGVEPNTKEGRILLGKEKVAHMAERGEKPAMLKRLVAKVKAWLRNYFPSIKWSDNDVLSLISNARDNVENRYMTKVDLDASTEQDTQEDSVNLSIRGDANPKDVNDIIGRTQAKPEHQKSLMERATDRLKVFKDIDTTAFKQAVIDSYASIETLEKKVNFGKLKDGAESAYKAALRTANLDSQVEAVMRRGALEFKDGAFQIKEGSKGFLEIFQKIADSEQLQLWETWAGAKRAKRIMEEDARANLDGQAALKEHRATINKLKKTTPANYPGGLTQWRKDMRAAENGMKDARTRAFQKRERLYKPSDIKRVIKYVNDNPELKAEFEKAQKGWRKFNKSMLDMAEQAGLIDPEARAIWEHDDYVPFHRVAEIEEEGGISQYATKRGLSGQKSGITQLKGGVEKLNIIESMVRNTIHLVDASNKNVAMQRVVDLADGVAMEKLPASKMDPEERDIMLRDFGYVPEDMDQDTLDAWTNQLERYNSIDKGVVSVSRNGKLHKYHVTDTGLFAAITQLGPMRVDGMLRVLGVPKRVLTASVTAAPGFMSANFVRDTLSTWVTVEAKTTPVYDAVKGAAKGLKRSESQWAIMAAGAGGGGYYDTSPDNVRQHLSPLNKGGAMHAPKRMWDAWMRVGQALENANRIAVYDSVIKDGGTVAEAAHQAQDVINFSKRGANKWVQAAITLIPFLNARIQGLERLYRGAKENPKAFFMKGTILMGASLAILATNWDNEEYWELDEWDRDANWHIFAGGEHFKIPKPFEVGAVFGTIPERVFEQFRKDADSKLLGERMLAMVTGTFAFDPLGAQFMKPALDVAFNERSFTGNPILGFGDQYRSPEGQYSPWTSESMKQLAESMPDSAPEWMRSPKRLEYLFKGYFGTLGGYALSLTDMATQEIVGAPDQPDATLGRYPVVKRFYSDELTGNKHVGRFYDMADEVNSIYADMKTKFEDGQKEQANRILKDEAKKLRLRSHFNKVRQQMSDISSQTRMIYMDKKMSSTEKRRRIDELTKRRNQIARAASLQFYGIF
ncbi:LPD38 domain-containing protein [Marinomonas atlantica]|uniref:LPD38 domain-containing protein n=1 Tax=Marinomonas atlantica TaxID=1806668 RepID=UPI000832A696|nr:LPD38 domain-containing protein [Marinomonas atlantica]